MADTTNPTLSLKALLERSSVRPGTTQQSHLVVDVTAIGAPVDGTRPSLSVVFVVDASGSMRGDPLNQVIASVGMLVDLLSPEDKVGVVAFSDEAAVVAPLERLTPDAKRAIKRRTEGIVATANTNISAGITKAASLLGARTQNERQVILLLSDGAPNRGAASSQALAELVEPLRANVSVSTLGYGAGHNADILHGVSVAGGGQYWFIPDPQEASLEFARALGAQGDIVADSIELVLSPADACEIKEVLGTKVRFGKAGPVVAIPDLREKQSRLVVAAVDITAPREAGRLAVADVTVRFRAAGQQQQQELKAALTIDVVDKEPALVVEAHHPALMARAERVRGDARAAADRGSFDQGAAMLRKIIGELEQAPGYVRADGSPLSECVEQLIDEAVEYEQRPSAERYAAFKATQLGVEVSQGAKHAEQWAGASARSAALMSGATGAAPDGIVIVRDALGNERSRLVLTAEMTIGRTVGNDIVIASGNLSKRHTRIVCRDGKVIVVDLRSTNGTYVNNKRIASPHALVAGDKVLIGDHVLEVVLQKSEPPKT